MWCDVGQSCAMMGLQATAGKRKLEGGVGCMEFDTEMGESPAKLGRVEGSWWAVEDSYTPQLNQTTSSYYDMEVSGPCPQANPCQPSSLPSPAASTLNQAPSQQQQQQQQHQQHQQQQQQQHQHYYHHHHQRGNANSAVNGSSGGGVGNNNVYGHQLSRPQAQWGGAPHHYEPPTIRREENGKSYLELGSSYRTNDRCCEGSRSSWCRRGRACYRQRRLAVLNISMCKLARYRQYPDPSLHRSVLICNTLRHLEREMERDRSPPPIEPVVQAPMVQLQPTEQGRLTPFPIPPNSSSGENDGDSGIGDSDDSRSINWGSVLSLSSQSPLDPLNNNELLDVDIGPELDLDFMPGWKLTPLSADDILRSTNAAVAAAAAQESNHHHNHYHLHHLHHHHHHHQLSSNGSTIITSPISSSCNGTSPGVTNTASTTHVESLMCVGS